MKNVMMCVGVLLCVSVMIPSGSGMISVHGQAESDGPEIWPTLQSLHVHIEVFNPIGDDDLKRYGEILALSPEQMMHVRSLHATEYTRSVQAIEGDRGPVLVRMADMFSRGISETPEFGEFYGRFREAEEDLCGATATADAVFLAQVEAILSEAQRERMTRVRLHRLRQQTIPRFAIRRARIDLADMIERSNLSAEARAACDAVVIEYERAFTSAFVEADRVRRENRARLDGWAVLIRFDEQGKPRDHGAPESQRAIAELQERRQRARHQQTSAQLRVASINDTFISRIVACLPDEAGRAMQIEYLSRAYERVYPDPTDPIGLYRRLISNDAFPGELQPLLDAHWDIYRREYDQLCAQMVALSATWQERHGRSGTLGGADAHTMAITNLQNRRLAVSAEFVTLIENLTPPALRDAMQPLFADWHARAARPGSGELRTLPGGDPR